MLEGGWKSLRVAALIVVAVGCGDERLGFETALERTDPLVWGGEQKLVASDAAELDQFGYSVSLAGDRAIVGAYGESSHRGAAYVFVRSGSSWTEEQKLFASDGADGDNFGWSVALAGGRAIVGAHGANSYRGAVYVFVNTGDFWTEEQKLVSNDGAEFDQLGYSVSLAEGRVLSGAPGDDTARGAGYVFIKSGRSGSSWIEEQKLFASDAVADDDFGYSVSLAEGRALIGAPGSGSYRGSAYVFVLNGSSWIEEQRLVATDGAEFDQLGNSVSLTEDRALLGAYWDDEFRGSAHVFVRSGSSWTEEQRLVASEATEGDRFGNSLSLDTDRALIGAFGSDSSRGAAYVFVRDGSAWTEEQRLVSSDGESQDLFAWSVSLAGERALVGANYNDQLRGSAYAFSLGLANGDACDTDGDCASGHCVDDRCCNRDCTGACGACSIAEGATVEGTCRIFAAGSEGAPSCGGLTCNGESPECARCQSDDDCPEARHCDADRTCQPRREQGEACDDRAGKDCIISGCQACQSGFCADGVCCDAACDRLCEACTAKLTGGGADGRCGPIEAGTDPEDECRDDGVATCESNGRCNGAGGCQRYPSGVSCEPEPCARGDECTSGHCEDGICCDRSCAPSERCRAELKVSGGDGACGPAIAAALGAPCKFEVECTSGSCADGECVSASGASALDDAAGCACRTGRSPGRTGSWIAVGLALLLRRARFLRGTRSR